jgi:DNA polymerase elongation subunit (family B)
MKILFLDIETAPHKVFAWGLWDQNISINQIDEPGYTLCYSAKWLGKKELMFASINQDGNHANMVTKIHELLEDADAVVHYNGTKFDIPTLNLEFLLAGLVPPSGYKEIDLLRVARHRFRFPSNKLDYVAQALGLGSKIKHRGMDLWKGCMDGDEKSWRTMEAYNKMDVRLLERVYKKMLPWIKQHPNYGLYLKSDRPVCKNCGSYKVEKKGMEYTQVGKYQRYRCTACGTPMRGATLQNTLEDRKRLLR